MLDDALRLLLIDDSAFDAQLLEERLQRDGLAYRLQRVDTESAFRGALAAGPDLIFSDIELHEFSARRALAILRETGTDIPLIVLTDILDESALVALELAGYAVVTASDGVKGLERLKAAPKPDLIITDINMKPCPAARRTRAAAWRSNCSDRARWLEGRVRAWTVRGMGSLLTNRCAALLRGSHGVRTNICLSDYNDWRRRCFL